MFREKGALKKVFTILCLTGFCISVNSATNGRGYALGQPYFLGDIINSVGQGWQMLGYPDQIQGSFDYTTPEAKSGPIIMIKSLGENVAIGASLSTFDKRTGGSILQSVNFLGKAMEFSGSSDFYTRFPNYPQLHFGFKIGQQKIGLDGWYEMQHYGINKSTSDSAGSTDSKKNMRVTNSGGKISARFAFGNLAWNPWFGYGVPYVNGTRHDVSVHTIADTVLRTNTDLTYSCNNEKRMITFGSCLDYSFGWGWAIIGGWYRNETFQFKIRTQELSTVNDSIIYSHDTSKVSCRYNNSFYDYFVSITPDVFENFLIGFEYEGGFNILRQRFEKRADADSTQTIFYNDFMLCMEKPIDVNRKWIDVFTIRAGLRWSIGRRELEVVQTNGSIEKWIYSISSKIDGMETTGFYYGFGYKKKRIMIDVAVKVLSWKDVAPFYSPPVGSLTMTVDLHK